MPCTGSLGTSLMALGLAVAPNAPVRFASPISFPSAFVEGLCTKIEGVFLPVGELGEGIIHRTTPPGAVQ